jgi:hypothetical protein
MRSDLRAVTTARPREADRRDPHSVPAIAPLVGAAPTLEQPDRRPRPPVRTDVTVAVPSCRGARGIYIFAEFVSIGPWSLPGDENGLWRQGAGLTVLARAARLDAAGPVRHDSHPSMDPTSAFQIVAGAPL